MIKSRVVAVVLAASLGGCAAEQRQENGNSADAGCAQVEKPERLPVIAINWQVKVLQPGTTTVVATLEAGSASGGAAYRAINEAGISVKSKPRSLVIDLDPVVVNDATSGDAAALASLYAETLALLDKCPEAEEEAGKCSSRDLWLASKLQRDVELSARTDEGALLAQWRFSGGFLAEFAGSSRAVATVHFAPETAAFSSESLGDLPGDFPVTKATLAAGSPPAEDELRAFAARYLSPEEWLAAMNRGAAGKALYVEASAARCDSEAGAKRAVCASAEASDGRRPGALVASHNFVLELGGEPVGGFKSVTGLQTEIEIIEYRDGSDAIVHRRPGKAKYKNITLRTGRGSGPGLHEWYRGVLAGTTDRKSGSIVVLDREGNEAMRYQFVDGFPTTFRVSETEEGSSGAPVREVDVQAVKIDPA